MMEYWQDIKNNPSKMKCVFDYVVDSIEDMKFTNEKAYWKARLGLHESIKQVKSTRDFSHEVN